MKKWKKIKTIETHDYNGFYKVEKDEVLTPGGKSGIYSVVRQNGAALTIPIDSEGKVYLVKQHRYPIDKFTFELPCGGVESGEESLSAAKRELEEEAGLVSGEWEKIGNHVEAISNNGFRVDSFIAHNVKKIENPKKDPLDKDLFEIKKYSLKKVMEMIKNNEIIDATSISSFCLAFIKGKLNKYLK